MSILSEIVEALTVTDDGGKTNLSKPELDWLVECGIRVPASVVARQKKTRMVYCAIENEERLELLKALGFREGVWGRYRDTVERVYETRWDGPIGPGGARRSA